MCERWGAPLGSLILRLQLWAVRRFMPPVLLSARRCRRRCHPMLPPACLQSYDVWNEILHLQKWMNTCGLWTDTFKDLFVWINDIDPDAKLCINE